MKHAFTLTELLVTLAIVLILGGLAFGGVTKTIALAHKAGEISAGRALVVAYLNYAADNDGQHMPGMDYRVNSLPGRPGAMSHACQRYPLRLAPYLGDSLDPFLAGKNRAALRKLNQGRETGAMYEYLVSCFPSFGMNIHLVGGQVYMIGRLSYPRDCLTGAGRRARVLVFATAASTDGETRVDGFNQILPPRGPGSWSAPPRTADSDPNSVGNLDARYNGRALAVFLNGSVEELTLKELEDMRLWCQGAADTDDAGYSPR